MWHLYQFWVDFNWLFFFIVDCTFLLLCLSDNLWLDSRYFEFYLIGYQIFLHSYRSHQLYFGMLLNYLETVRSFSGLGIMICQVGLEWCSMSKADYFPLLRQDLLEYFIQYPTNYEFSSQAGGEHTLFLAPW